MIGNRFIAALALVAGLSHPVWAQGGVTPAVQTWQEFVASYDSFGTLSAEERTTTLAELGAALRDDPLGVSDDLERSIGGGQALREYMAAMLADGALAELVDQVHVVMHAGETQKPLADVLNASEQQDGSAWFPKAEQAGFVVGSLAAVLDGSGQGSILSWLGGRNEFADASKAIATRFDIAAPAAQDTATEWLLEAFTNAESGLAVPAAQWFEKGFDKGYR